MESEANSNDLRIASFSVYLNSAQESFVHKLGVEECPPPPPPPMNFKKLSNGEGEIGVFSAEKYFNMSIDDGCETDTTPRLTSDYARKLVYKGENHVVPTYNNTKSRVGTPSISSETSSNSQTALMRSFQRIPYQGKQNNVNGRSFFAGFGCHKSCADKKSIYVSKDIHGSRRIGINREDVRKECVQNPPSILMVDDIQNQRQNQPKIIQVKDELRCMSFDKVRAGLNRAEEHFTFPILNSGLQNVSVGRKLQEDVVNKEEEPGRMSLEVFGSNLKKKRDAISMNLERKLSMLTWDAIPKSHTSSKGGLVNDDLESEASSDLFEIENLSGTSSVPPLLSRHVSDSISAYAPSEASIEWSVITASAADFSVVSDYDEKDVLASTYADDANKAIHAKGLGDKDVPKTRQGTGSGLLGCKSHKSVKVVETAHKMNENSKNTRPHQKFDAVRKLPIDNKVIDLVF